MSGEMANVSEAEILAFRRKQKKALQKEKQTPSKLAKGDVADSSATETDTIRRKRQKVATPSMIPQATPIATAAPPANPTVASSSQPTPIPPRTAPSWTQILQGFEGEESDRPHSLWDAFFNFGDVIDKHALLSDDIQKFSNIGVEGTCQAILASSLRAASMARSLEKELGGFDKTQAKMKKDLDAANLQADKYMGMAQELRDQLHHLEEKKTADDQELKNRITELEQELNKEKLLREKKQSALDSSVAEIRTLQNKITEDATQHDKTVFKLKSDLVNQFEAGFAKAIRQLNSFHPGVDTSAMDAFKVLRDGQWVEEAEEDEDEE